MPLTHTFGTPLLEQNGRGVGVTVMDDLGGCFLLQGRTLVEVGTAVVLASPCVAGALPLFATRPANPLAALGAGGHCGLLRGVAIPWVARQNIVNVHPVAFCQVLCKLRNLLAHSSRYTTFD